MTDKGIGSKLLCSRNSLCFNSIQFDQRCRGFMLIWPHWIRHSVPPALKVTLVSGLARSQPCVNAAPRTSTLILHRLRDALLTEDVWEHLMKQTPARVPDLTPFITALHLRPTIESVVEHNVARLHASGQPVATINAIHTGPNAAKCLVLR